LTSAALLAATGGARTAAQGDTVSVHYALKDEDGTVLDSSQARNEPVRAWGMGVVCVRGREN
jgi:FKBP-type peptidyl-prolyl cis-trans isomerase